MADIFPSHQETRARKIKVSQFSWIEMACTDSWSCWSLRQEILTANQVGLADDCAFHVQSWNIKPWNSNATGHSCQYLLGHFYVVYHKRE